MRFIKVTDKDNVIWYINIDDIASFTASNSAARPGSKTILFYRDNRQFFVNESTSEILEAMCKKNREWEIEVDEGYERIFRESIEEILA